MTEHIEHLLTAYIHDELPVHLRGRVTRHLESCDVCYAAFARERELTRLLTAQLPALSTPRPEQLTRLRGDILASVGETSARRSQAPQQRLPGWGFALVMSVALLLLMPALVLPGVAAVDAPAQHGPAMIAATATQSLTDAPLAYSVAAVTAVAARSEAATEPPALNPSPVPEVQATPGQ